MSNLKLDGALVKDVSRSFYLTLRLLPANIREAISLGYLLARASDTIADSHEIPLDIRITTLEFYTTDVAKGQVGAHLQELIRLHFTSQRHAGEQVLMSALTQVVAAVNSVSDHEQELLQKVVATIIRGQMWDLTYFREGGVTIVETDQLLDDYIYSVAGCVGEFWTEILCLHHYIPTHEKEEMMSLGVNYGKGLQLTNILRDVPEDLIKSRVYIPSETAAFPEVVASSQEWLEKAMTYLRQGEEYAQRLGYGRLRSSTLLPARLGLRTLELIEGSSVDERREKVKISRQTVFKELFKTFL